MAAPSSGHYASLSFAVIGRGQRPGDRGQKSEEGRKKKGILLLERRDLAL
jgi:hypothetical protein